jgi:uncharacterized protein
VRFIERNLKWIALAVLIAVVAAIIATIVTSLPPREFTILTGREGGAYYQAAQKYQALAAERGFTLNIVPTAGSVDTLARLKAGEAEIGFVQGGIAVAEDAPNLSTLASVFYEPVWVLYPKGLKLNSVAGMSNELQGRRIGIGEAGSGANQLVRQLLDDVGLTGANAALLELPNDEAAAALHEGDLDLAFFVAAPGSTFIQSLLRDPELELLSLRRADAFAVRHRFLSRLTVPAGAFDMVRNIPNQDTEVISTVANLVVSDDFHPDLMRLMTIAAVETHEEGGIFEARYEFPNVDHADLPVDKEGLAYLNRIKSGESTFDNYLPFWAAALIDRYLLFVVPFALLLIPMLSRTPLVYIWYMRNKVTRWYKTVRTIELRVPNMNVEEIDAAIKHLEGIDDTLVEELELANSYMPAVYDLRTHISYVIQKLERRRNFLTSNVVVEPDAGATAQPAVSQPV